MKLAEMRAFFMGEFGVVNEWEGVGSNEEDIKKALRWRPQSERRMLKEQSQSCLIDD